MPIGNRSTSVRAKFTGLGQRSEDGVYDHGWNTARSIADGGGRESLLAERRGHGNSRGEKKVDQHGLGRLLVATR